MQPFDVLGVRQPESAEAFDIAPISKAYRRLSLQYHPDKNSSEDAAVRFGEVQAAYMLLCDDAKRQEYFSTLFGDRSHEIRVAQLQQAATDASARLAKRQADAASAEAARLSSLAAQQQQRAAASSGLGSILYTTANAIEVEMLAKWEVDSLDVLEAKEAEVLAKIERLERGTLKRARA